MAFLNGIFGQGNKQQPQQAPNQQQPNQQQQQQQGPQGGNLPPSQQQQPANQQMQNAGNNPSNPMDPFMDLLRPKPQQGQQGQQTPGNPQTPPSMFGQVDPNALKQQLGQVDFASGMDPSIVQKALGGDQQAFMDAMNSVARNVFQHSLQMSQGMVEHGVKFGTEQMTSGLDSRFRDYELRNQTVDNPALNHPFGQAMLTGIKQQIAKANPKLSAREVHQKAIEAMSTFTDQMYQSNQQQQNSQNPQPAEKDWLSSFMPDEFGGQSGQQGGQGF
jgi:hypothetical protein